MKHHGFVNSLTKPRETTERSLKRNRTRFIHEIILHKAANYHKWNWAALAVWGVQESPSACPTLRCATAVCKGRHVPTARRWRQILPDGGDAAVPLEAEADVNAPRKAHATVKPRVTLTHRNALCILQCKSVAICILIY